VENRPPRSRGRPETRRSPPARRCGLTHAPPSC